MLCVFSKIQESQPAAISTKHHVAVVPREGTSNDCHFVGGRCPQMCHFATSRVMRPVRQGFKRNPWRRLMCMKLRKVSRSPRTEEVLVIVSPRFSKIQPCRSGCQTRGPKKSGPFLSCVPSGKITIPGPTVK